MSGYTLSNHHLNALRLVVDAASADAPEVAVSWDALATVRMLLRSDLVMFEGADYIRGRSYFSQTYADGIQAFSQDIDPTAKATFWRLVRLSTPNQTWLPQTDNPEVIAPTDTMSVQQWRALPVYVDALGMMSRVSTTYQLIARAPDGFGRRLTLICFRFSGRDYNDRDHFDLQLLLPHLEAAYRRGQRRRATQSLTVRQRDLLELVRDGYTNTQIAHRLHLTHGTVRTHLNNIYARLGVQSRTEAVTRLFSHQ